MNPNPSSILFEKHLRLAPNSHLLLLNISDPALISLLSRHTAAIDLYHRDWRAQSDLRARFAKNPKISLHEATFPEAPAAPFDYALIDLPKGRGLAQAMLVKALQALKPDGILYAAGSNHGGAKTAQTDLALLTSAPTLGTKNRYRLFSGLRPSELNELNIPPEWAEPWQPRQIVFKVGGRDYPLYTQQGIFSYDRLDAGTALLLAQLPKLTLPNEPHILDAGCGLGIIGLVAEDLFGGRVIWSDVDLLALNCLRLTRPDAANQIIAADLTQAEALMPRAPFDLILCNPPFHEDHEKSTAFMQDFSREAARRLRPDGAFVLVFNRFLPYQEMLEAHFNRVRPLAETNQYLVVQADGLN